MTFFVRESDDERRSGIVDASEELVRTLDSGVALAAGDEVTYEWDGRDDAGAAPPGRYRLYVELPGEDREMVWPRRISVEVPTTTRACGS